MRRPLHLAGALSSGKLVVLMMMAPTRVLMVWVMKRMFLAWVVMAMMMRMANLLRDGMLMTPIMWAVKMLAYRYVRVVHDDGVDGGGNDDGWWL